MNKNLQIECRELADTFRIGRRLGELLFPGAVIALIGPLGAGKTHFVRAVAEGLAISDSRVVTSPTFVLIQEYEARLPIYHFDAYRLRSSDEFADLGVDEYFAGDGVCLIEWADRVMDVLPAQRMEIHMEVTGAETRKIDLVGIGGEYESLLNDLSKNATD